MTESLDSGALATDDPTPSATTETPTATPTPSPSATTTPPAETATSTPAPSATTTPTPSATVPAEPSTTTITETEDALEVPTATVPTETVTTVIWQQAPAAQDSPITGWAAALALAALALVLLTLALLRRRGELRETPEPAAPVQPTLFTSDSDDAAAPPEEDLTSPVGPVETTVLLPATTSLVLGARGSEPGMVRAVTRTKSDEADLLRFLISLGEALIDCSSPIAEVQQILEEIATVNGHPETEIIGLPTALLVTVPGARAQTAASRAGGRALRFDQVEGVLAVVQEARSGDLDPREGSEQLREVIAQPPPHNEAERALGYLIQCVGLALILGAGWLELVVVAALGGMVALLRMATARRGANVEPLVILGCSFLVAGAALGLTRAGVDVDVLPTLVPPLVVFLPGALLTTGVIDLATGQMIAGAARLASGLMQLVLLVIGVAAAAGLVGVRAGVITDAGEGLGVLAPWIGVVFFTYGVALNQCLRRSAFGWVLVVVTTAYAGSVLGGLVFGAVMSAFIGAAVMTPVASYLATVKGGPPALVSFLPAFWVLVPGSLALVGLTAAFSGTSGGLTTLLTAAATMVSVSLGVLVGLTATGIIGRWRHLVLGNSTRN